MQQKYPSGGIRFWDARTWSSTCVRLNVFIRSRFIKRLLWIHCVSGVHGFDLGYRKLTIQICPKALAFCQGFAFYICVLAPSWWKGESKRFAKPLAPPAKDSLRSSFASGGLSRLRRSILTLRARGLFLTDRVKPSLWQRLRRPKMFHFIQKNVSRVFSVMLNSPI